MNHQNGDQLREHPSAGSAVQGHVGVFPYVGYYGEHTVVVRNLQTSFGRAKTKRKGFQREVDVFCEYRL